jgi:ABC-2 type transport system ATP-binding protein
MPSITTISIDKLSRLVGTPHCPALIDVRTDADYNSDPRLIPSSIRRPHADASAWAGGFVGRSAIVICQKGGKLSEGAAAWLRHDGVPADGLQRAALLMEVAALTKRYGDQRALADVSFAVHTGEVLGLIGPNGAGKTTLLEAVAGLIPVNSGEVRWGDRTLTQTERREHIFYLPDDVRPWSDQYVIRVVEFFAGVYRRSHDDIATTIAAVALAPVLGKRVFVLSKGYARRLIWALALLAPHPLLLMDEPFDGFDLKQTRQMRGLLREMLVPSRTLILSIHQLSDAERVCDRFVLLTGGRVCGVGTLEELRVQADCPKGGLEEVFLALT